MSLVSEILTLNDLIGTSCVADLRMYRLVTGKALGHKLSVVFTTSAIWLLGDRIIVTQVSWLLGQRLDLVEASSGTLNFTLQVESNLVLKCGIYLKCI